MVLEVCLCAAVLTVNDRKEEKSVPSSYLEILANTLSRMTTNWERGEEKKKQQGNEITYGNAAAPQSTHIILESKVFWKPGSISRKMYFSIKSKSTDSKKQLSCGQCLQNLKF